MKFTIANQRAIMGNDIDVTVEADEAETITGVVCSLDGFEIGAEDFSATPVVSFHRLFNKAGDAGPNQTHKILVEARVPDGNPSLFGVHMWTDIS